MTIPDSAGAGSGAGRVLGVDGALGVAPERGDELGDLWGGLQQRSDMAGAGQDDQRPGAQVHGGGAGGGRCPHGIIHAMPARKKYLDILP